MRRVSLLVVLALVALACAPDGAATTSSTTTTTRPATTATTEAATTTTIPVASTIAFEDPQATDLLFDITGLESGSISGYSGAGTNFDVTIEFLAGTVALESTGRTDESIDGTTWREIHTGTESTAWVDDSFLSPNTAAPVPFSETPCSTFGSPDDEIARSAPAASDADHVAQIWQVSWPGCTRIVIALGAGFDLTDAAPLAAAVPGDVSVEAFGTWARVTMPAVQWTRADGAADVGDATIVVSRTSEGVLVADIHAGAPAEYFARFLTDPARVVIDILATPAAAVIVAPPVVGEAVILAEGLPPTVNLPFDISGYSRWFEAAGLVMVRRAGDEPGSGEVIGAIVRGETVTEPGSGTVWGVMATDWLDAWGMFSFELDGLGSGNYELFIGECRSIGGDESCREAGVYLPLVVGG